MLSRVLARHPSPLCHQSEMTRFERLQTNAKKLEVPLQQP